MLVLNHEVGMLRLHVTIELLEVPLASRNRAHAGGCLLPFTVTIILETSASRFLTTQIGLSLIESGLETSRTIALSLSLVFGALLIALAVVAEVVTVGAVPGDLAIAGAIRVLLQPQRYCVSDPAAGARHDLQVGLT
jgi:hypothetical protein